MSIKCAFALPRRPGSKESTTALTLRSLPTPTIIRRRFCCTQAAQGADIKCSERLGASSDKKTGTVIRRSTSQRVLRKLGQLQAGDGFPFGRESDK